LGRQVGISVVYPESLDGVHYTGSLSGPVDTILDMIARRHDLRVNITNNVAFIGRSLPEDRSIASVRTWLPEADKVVQPLLSESGHVSFSSSYLFITDRAENISKVLNAVSVNPSQFAVQVLEVYIDNNFQSSFSIANGLDNSKGWSISSNLENLLSLSLSDSGVYVGRSQFVVAVEGSKVDTFIGTSEQISTVTAIPNNSSVFSTSSTNQVGWRFQFIINAGVLSGSVSNNNGSDQYSFPFSLVSPGTYLVSSSFVRSTDRHWGLPSSGFSSDLLRRAIWLRYYESDLLSGVASKGPSN
jgi:hypothetical protein